MTSAQRGEGVAKNMIVVQIGCVYRRMETNNCTLMISSPYSSEAEHQSCKLGVVSSILTGGMALKSLMSDLSKGRCVGIGGCFGLSFLIQGVRKLL